MLKDVFLYDTYVIFKYSDRCDMALKYYQTLVREQYTGDDLRYMRDYDTMSIRFDYKINMRPFEDKVMKWTRENQPKNETLDILRLAGYQPVAYKGDEVIAHIEKDIYQIKGETISKLGNIDDPKFDLSLYGCEAYDYGNGIILETDGYEYTCIQALGRFKDIKRQKKFSGIHLDFINANIKELESLIKNSYIQIVE